MATNDLEGKQLMPAPVSGLGTIIGFDPPCGKSLTGRRGIVALTLAQTTIRIALLWAKESAAIGADRAMTEGFDPYYKWLGIRPEEQPASHYRLLGIAPFESDPEVISNAADQRMVHLRSYQVGPYAAYSQHLLNEVSAARICLLTPEKKAEYDFALRARLSPQMAGPGFDPVFVPRSTAIKSRFARRRDNPVMLYVLLSLGVAAVGLVAFLIAQPQSRRPASPAPARTVELPRGAETSHSSGPVVAPMPAPVPEKKLPPNTAAMVKPLELPPVETVPRLAQPAKAASGEKAADAIGVPLAPRMTPDQAAAGLDERFKAAKTPGQLRSAAEAALQLAGRLVAAGNPSEARAWLERAKDAGQRAGAEDLVRWATLQLADLPEARGRKPSAGAAKPP